MACITVKHSRLVPLAAGLPLNALFESNILDFSNMIVGSIHVKWEGQATNSGVFEVFIGNFENKPDLEPFCAVIQVNAGCTGHLFDFAHNFIGFRFAYIKYTPNGETAGTFKIHAVGKRHGGIN